MVQSHSSPSHKLAYYSTVWEVVRQIPPGKVATYGQIAALIPTPDGMSERSYLAFGARWVGGAMAACPEGVPWQRVINSQGKISLKPGSGSQEQRTLLENEGIVFDANDRIELKKFRWDGKAVNN